MYLLSFVFMLTMWTGNFSPVTGWETGEEKVWNLTPDSIHWSRTKDALTISFDETTPFKGTQTVKAIHTGSPDWNFTSPKDIPVKPGEVYEISCFVKVEGEGVIGNSVVLMDGNRTIQWGYGRVEQKGTTDWKELKTRFIIPYGANKIRPRLAGNGPATVWFGPHIMRKLESVTLLPGDTTFTLENQQLLLTLLARDGSLSVLDKRTGRTWKPEMSLSSSLFLMNVKKESNRLAVRGLDPATMQQFDIVFELDKERPEFSFSLNSNPPKEMTSLAYPFAFQSIPGDRLIVPMTEGFAYSVTEKAGTGKRVGYGGHGLCMSFWGHLEEEMKSGYMVILETPDDASAEIRTYQPDGKKESLLVIGPLWESQKGLFGYRRSCRYVFVDDGGHVALCKRYRKYVQQTGLWVPFSEKVKRNPGLADKMSKLFGAANIWYFGNEKLKVFNEMKELGMNRFLWSGGGNGEEIAEMNKTPGVLTSRYDIYQDIVSPELHSQLAGIPGRHIQKGWPKDIMWKDSQGNTTKGWGAPNKDPDKPRIRCDVLCDSKAIPYAIETIGKELKTIPYNTRFIDTTTSTPWRECWNPDHPMTRTESRIWKMKLLELIGKRFNLICGSETGHDASVPYCDFFEGMMSMGGYIVPSDAKTLDHFYDDAPAAVIKYSNGETYRLPLWELVYHDCTVSYSWWYDFNNVRKQIWRKRDLFNVMYGTPPMYRFTRSFWNEHKNEIVESWRFAQPVSEMTGGVEMTDHRYLTKDRSVQETVFANGVSVVVNFGNTPYKKADGTSIAPLDYKVTRR